MADDIVDPQRLHKIAETISSANVLTPEDLAYFSKVIHVISGLQFYSRNDDYLFDIFRLYKTVNSIGTEQAIGALLDHKRQVAELVALDPQTPEEAVTAGAWVAARLEQTNKDGNLRDAYDTLRDLGLSPKEARDALTQRFSDESAGDAYSDESLKTRIQRARTKDLHANTPHNKPGPDRKG